MAAKAPVGRWEYRNVSSGMLPPCPVCGFSMVKKPTHPSGKYVCEAAKCRATFQARWVPADTAVQSYDDAGATGAGAEG